MFAEHEEELGSEMVTETASVEDFNMAITASPKSQPDGTSSTVTLDDTTSDRVSTRIVELEIETSGTQRPIPTDRVLTEPVPNQSNVEHIPEEDEPNEPVPNNMTPEFDQQWPSSTVPNIKATEITSADAPAVDSTTQKVVEHMPTEDVHDVAMATSSNEVERTIMIVNDESETANNEVRDEHREAQQQKTNGAMKSTAVAFAFVASTLLFAF
uniref:Uncharacterized protein n=1 Tax=Parascaris univalens TaxID=6257 RepID=A0A914ZZY7_PARUN